MAKAWIRHVDNFGRRDVERIEGRLKDATGHFHIVVAVVLSAHSECLRCHLPLLKSWHTSPRIGANGCYGPENRQLMFSQDTLNCRDRSSGQRRESIEAEPESSGWRCYQAVHREGDERSSRQRLRAHIPDFGEGPVV